MSQEQELVELKGVDSPQASLNEIVNEEIYQKHSFRLHSTIPVEMMFKDVNIWLEKRKGLCCKKQREIKHILKNVSGEFKVGTSTAILGSSGSGKTTLLNYLSSRMSSSALKSNGNLYVNGCLVDSLKEIKHKVGYVEQFDTLLPDFTPKEQFEYGAKLAGIKKPDEKVAEVIKVLNLEKCMDTRTGSELSRGISGGERKRTSIGLELITDPSLLFLDEPTTGLDSKSALDVATLLKRLAESGRTLITTIHSPSAEILNQFDNIICMAQGEIIFNGPPSNLETFFDEVGLPAPPLTNPADHLMTIIHEDDFRVKALQSGEAINEEEIKKIFKTRLESFSRHYKANNTEPQPVENTPIELSKIINFPHNISQCRNLFILWKRTQIFAFRNPQIFQARIGLHTGFALMTMALLSNTVDFQDSTFQAIIDKGGMGLNVSSFFCFAGFFGTLFIFLPSLPTFRRESEKRLIGPLTYYFTTSLFMLPFDLLLNFLWLLSIFWVINIRNDSVATFLKFFALFSAAKFSANGLGDLLSVSIRNLEMVNEVQPLTLVPLFVLNGFTAQTKIIGWHMRIISYLSFFRFAFQGTMVVEFDDETLLEYRQACRLPVLCSDTKNDECFLKVPISNPLNNSCDASVLYDFYENSLWSNIVILIGLAIFYRFFAAIAIVRYAKESNTKNDPIPEEIQEEVIKRKAHNFGSKGAPKELSPPLNTDTKVKADSKLTQVKPEDSQKQAVPESHPPTPAQDWELPEDSGSGNNGEEFPWRDNLNQYFHKPWSASHKPYSK